MENYGFKPSVIDGTEHEIALPKSLDLPESYTYEDILPDVLDQGSYSICVPCSISAYLNWRENLKDGEPIDNDIKLFEIYNAKTNEGDGMTFKEAFAFLRKKGVNSKEGKLKIGEYAILRGVNALKYAILANGPCVGALPVYGGHSEFWDRENGKGALLGYHAISLVGYTEEGIIVRNSWGKSFGNNGYTLLKNGDIGKLLEAWTIVS